MATAEPVAIIDIGSNSVRLVVYAGSERIPVPIFNEKVLAGLGKGLDESGRLPERAREKALATLRRFRLLIDHMRIGHTHVLATAAVRDAADGADFVRDVRRIGLECRVLSAEEEADLAGEGVLSGIPEAHGLVGDLGGGSLELVPVAEGRTEPGISLPLGVLRLDPTADGERAARKELKAAIRDSGLKDRARGRAFYAVGGSWRALARIDMLETDFPLPIQHQYAIKPERLRELRSIVQSHDPQLKQSASSPRLATSPQAAMLLQLIAEELEPSAIVISTFGIREGLIYSRLKPAVRRLDPLAEEAREAGGGEHRFGQHGDLLDDWIGPLFDDEPAMRRLRLASCLLADVAWQANPGFRADRAIEMALHGNWVAVSPGERVVMAQALSSNFGREELPDPRPRELCSQPQLRRAHCWGVAMRLGQRLSGGVGSVLERTRLSCDENLVRLHVHRGEEALVGALVERRLVKLGEALGRDVEVAAA